MNAAASIDPRFVAHRGDREFVLYAGLLDQAHREGLRRISTKLLQTPNADNGQVAIVWAEVETERGIYSGIGDASPENVGRMIAMHTIRMAETRAKARALRDAINVGMAALEELGDDAEMLTPRGAEINTTRKTEGGLVSTVLHGGAICTAAGTPASKDQLRALAKLQAAVGRSVNIPASITTEAAAAQIAELSRLFNTREQKAGAHRA
jgi:hypothetical protein